MRPSPQQIQDFVRYARSPSTWASAARRQLAVAEVLHQRKLTYKAGTTVLTEEYAGCVSAMYFHLGLALENSAKAFLVARDPTVITETGQVDRKKLGNKGGHGLIGLCEVVLPDMHPKEQQLLAKLQEHVIWLGKYGTPMDAAPLYDAALMDIIRVSTPDEWPMARSIFERMNSRTRGAPGDA